MIWSGSLEHPFCVAIRRGLSMYGTACRPSSVCVCVCALVSERARACTIAWHTTEVCYYTQTICDPICNHAWPSSLNLLSWNGWFFHSNQTNREKKRIETQYFWCSLLSIGSWYILLLLCIFQVFVFVFLLHTFRFITVRYFVPKHRNHEPHELITQCAGCHHWREMERKKQNIFSVLFTSSDVSGIVIDWIAIISRVGLIWDHKLQHVVASWAFCQFFPGACYRYQTFSISLLNDMEYNIEHYVCVLSTYITHFHTCFQIVISYNELIILII